MVCEVVLLEMSRASYGWEFQSPSKTTRNALHSWNPSVQLEQLRTVDSSCWGNCPCAYTHHMWSSVTYFEFLSSGESWMHVCWVPLLCLFSWQEGLASEDRIHTSLLAQHNTPYGHTFLLTVYKRVPQMSWCAYPPPLKYWEEDKPSGSMGR